MFSRTKLFATGCGIVVVFFFAGMLIGYFTLPSKTTVDTSSREGFLSAGDVSIKQKLLEEIQAKNIRNYLKELTERPHLAGTPADKEQADDLASFWMNAGLDHVNVVPYDVLLSYPSKTNPNRIVLYDGENQALHTSQLVEKVVRPEQNQSDVVPPFNAFSAPGTPRGTLVYVNYGRVEDFTWLREQQGINFTGTICIARYGKIFRGDKAKAAEKFGASGLILYSDPADYAVSGVHSVYPDSWWLPGTGVQRGSIFVEGDALTPDYPSTKSAYRLYENETELPRIPVHPVGYEDAQKFLEHMSGPEAPQYWQGSLPFIYRLGPGFVNSTWEVQMFISTHSVRRTIYNAFGFIRGTVEPDRHVLMGNHRDAWVFGAVDPSSGTAVMMEISRAMGKLVQEGWRPLRTIVFCSWAAEEQGLIGSREYVEHFGKILRERAVAYINVDSAVVGNYSFRARALPMMFDVLYDIAKGIPNPDDEEVARGRTRLWDTWRARYPARDETDNPHISILGSGSDFDPFVTKIGVTSADFSYRYDYTTGISSYPLYHSVYETFHLFDNYIDPTFKLSRATAQYTAETVRRLAEATLLPFNVQAYSTAVRQYYQTLVRQHGDLLRAHGLNTDIDYLDEAVSWFERSTLAYTNAVKHADLNNPLMVRQINDQMMALERNFIDPVGLPGRPRTRNVLFAPSAHDAYSGASFPGITDTLFEIEKSPAEDYETRWNAVRKAIAAVTFCVETAHAGLQNSTNYMDYSSHNA